MQKQKWGWWWTPAPTHWVECLPSTRGWWRASVRKSTRRTRRSWASPEESSMAVDQRPDRQLLRDSEDPGALLLPLVRSATTGPQGGGHQIPRRPTMGRQGPQHGQLELLVRSAGAPREARRHGEPGEEKRMEATLEVRESVSPQGDKPKEEKPIEQVLPRKKTEERSKTRRKRVRKQKEENLPSNQDGQKWNRERFQKNHGDERKGLRTKVGTSGTWRRTSLMAMKR